MEFDSEFEPLRPFNDSEVPAAIKELMAHEKFKDVIPHLSIGKHPEELIEILSSINSIDAFQSTFSHPFVKFIIQKTTDGLTSSGIEDIKGKGHLYIANHRDIILDTAFLQAMLKENNLSTTEITVGDNLMANDLFRVLGKLNKVFTLKRGGGKIEMYKNAILHSKYINHVIREKNESLWIAQSDGRTKDGNDKTQQGLLKMLLGNRRDIIPALQELAIVPMSISYEFEPCFSEKVNELAIKARNGEYIKQENEDMRSSTSSLFAKKGRVHIAFGTRLNKSLADIEERGLSNVEVIDTFLTEIDTQIYKNYRLWPNNYIAFDLLHHGQQFSKEYCLEDKTAFEKYLASSIENIEGDMSEIRKIALGIYANPVKKQI